MGSLRNRNVIIAKGFLFLLLGIVASAILLLHVPSFRVAILLIVAIWAFCRFYYFAFYVIEHYVDSRYRFSGIYSFVCFMVRTKATERHNKAAKPCDEPDPENAD